MARKRVAKTTTVVTAATNDGTIVISRRTIEKGGLISFAREGVRASLYFNKTMFVSESPVELTLTADNLRAPSTPPPTPDAPKAKTKTKTKTKATEGKTASAPKRKRTRKPAPEKSAKPRRARSRKSA
tara:strand:- start:6447 stop:6830 length:384 start_codon:yes stop_codon:yes gene_type:complete